MEQGDLCRVQQNTLDAKTECKQFEIQLNDNNNEFKLLLDQIESFHVRRLDVYRDIEDINIMIDNQSKSEHTINLNCIDTDTNITKMQAERNKILLQYENITI